MLSFSTRASRRLVPACVLATAAIAALGAPGAASASRLPKCTEGTKINGEGSTLQATAMKETWGEKSAKAYNSAGQTNPKACPGGPEITYNTKSKTGSGKGMENWYGLEEYGPEAQGFVGTDNAPNAEIKEKIEKEGTGGKVLTIPTLQAAVALIVHLPDRLHGRSGTRHETAAHARTPRAQAENRRKYLPAENHQMEQNQRRG